MNMVCDKTDAFPFSVLGMSHLDSNILSKIYYASKGSVINF